MSRLASVGNKLRPLRTMNYNSNDAREPLLKVQRAGYDVASHSRTAVSSLLEAGHHDHTIKPDEQPTGNVTHKQIIASIGIILSAGAKIVHMGIQFWSEWAHDLAFYSSKSHKLCCR